MNIEEGFRRITWVISRVGPLILILWYFGFSIAMILFNGGWDRYVNGISSNIDEVAGFLIAPILLYIIPPLIMKMFVWIIDGFRQKND